MGSILLSVWMLIFIMSSTAMGHFVEQFYVDVQPKKKQLLLNFDVGYAIAETRDNPNEPQPLRDWLMSISAEEHAKYREEAESYLRTSIRFIRGGASIAYDVRFPDFDSALYDFPKLLNRGAYYNVELVPEIWDETVTVELLDTNFPKLVLAFIEPESGESSFETIDNGESVLLRNHKEVQAGQVVLDDGSEKTGSSFWQLLKLGYRHVIPDGADHILFIMGMCLMAFNLKSLLWQSAVFTVAHSVSMGLVVAGLLPVYAYSISSWIEPIIALSIAFIAVESIFKTKSKAWRFGSIGVFGFVHGLGFAGSLGSALQFVIKDGWLGPLLISNLGIELAQILLIVLIFGLLYLLKRTLTSKWFSMVKNSAALVIACIGVMWFFQRIA